MFNNIIVEEHRNRGKEIILGAFKPVKFYNNREDVMKRIDEIGAQLGIISLDGGYKTCRTELRRIVDNYAKTQQ